MTENMNHTDQTQEMKEPSEGKNQEEKVSNSKTENTEPETDKKSGDDANDSSENDTLLTELQKKYDTVNDKYLRLYSEFENFRRRTAKEKLDAMLNRWS